MDEKRYHFLFAVFMAGGNATIYNNMKGSIGRRGDVDSSWLPMEVFPKDFITRIPPISLNGTLTNSAATRMRIRAIEKRGVRFDAAYYFQHTIVTFLYGFRRQVPYLMAMDGTPMWYAKHGLWYTHKYFNPGSPVSKLKQAITRSVYHKANHLLPLSTGVRDSLIEDYGVPASRVTVMPPGIDVEKWQCPERRVNGAAKNPFRILFVGADFLRKGGDLLLSLSRRPEFQGVEFHFVTKSYTGEKRQNVFIHSDLSINSRELIDLYRAADVFVMPTRNDTHSIASLEAMATGLPVVATNVGGIGDIVLDGETGFIVGQDDEDALADRLRRLLQKEELRISFGKKSRHRIEKHFNQGRHSELIIELLKKSAADRHSRRL